jgi:hypothetical protein
MVRDEVAPALCLAQDAIPLYQFGEASDHLLAVLAIPRCDHQHRSITISTFLLAALEALERLGATNLLTL